MKTIEIITNGLNGFELNRTLPRNDMWKVAQEAGFEGSRTSFFRLVDGKVESTVGYSIKVQNVVMQSPKVVTHLDKTAALKAFSFKTHIVEANTETYGTVNVNCGRVQINPLNNGMFSVLVLPKKGYSVADAVKEMGFGTPKSQYVQAGKLTAAEVTSLVNRLI